MNMNTRRLIEEKIIQVEQISKLSKFRWDKPREKIIIQFPEKGKAI